MFLKITCFRVIIKNVSVVVPLRGKRWLRSVTLQEETALRVKQLEVKLAHFEADTSMTDCCLIEIDEELEEGRASLEKLEKRVTELETELPELITERVATLKTENVELRNHLNLVVDTVNNITRIWNEQVDEGEPQDEVKVIDDDVEPTMEDNEPPQLTLQQVYNMYQSQPRDEEGWEEMTKAIEAAEQYEASLPIRTNGLTQDEWNDLLQI